LYDQQVFFPLKQEYERINATFEGRRQSAMNEGETFESWEAVPPAVPKEEGLVLDPLPAEAPAADGLL
jgi:hypothetical protein